MRLFYDTSSAVARRAVAEGGPIQAALRLLTDGAEGSSCSPVFLPVPVDAIAEPWGGAPAPAPSSAASVVAAARLRSRCVLAAVVVGYVPSALTRKPDEVSEMQ